METATDPNLVWDIAAKLDHAGNPGRADLVLAIAKAVHVLVAESRVELAETGRLSPGRGGTRHLG